MIYSKFFLQFATLYEKDPVLAQETMEGNVRKEHNVSIFLFPGNHEVHLYFSCSSDSSSSLPASGQVII